MEDIIDIIVTETTNLIEITSQPTDEIIDVNIIDNREDITLNVTPSLVEININSLTGNFGVNWGDIEGTLSDQTDLQDALDLKADLVDGKVPSSQLPSYVDDIIEVATYSALPVTGETGKIYVILDTNLIYRWSGSVYIEIKDSSAVWGAITGTLSSQTDLQSALNAKVPYTGATGNVNLGEYGATVGYLGFDTTPTSTPTGIGTMYWDSANRTVSLIDGDGDTTLQIGQEERVLVHNNTGSTLTDGQVVYVTGSTGELPSVALASNTTEATSSVTFGIVTESIAHGADGFVTTSGIVHGLNTNAFTEGAALWLGSTAGTFTETKPVAPANSVLIGYVIKKAGGNGSIFVKIQNGNELEELHDVLITSVANNDGLFYESSSSLWKNKSIATVLGYTPQAQLNGTGFVKASGTTISYDNSTYLTTSSAASTYLAKTGGTLTGSLNGTTAVFSGAVWGQTGYFSNTTADNALAIFQSNASYHAVTITNSGVGGSALYVSGGSSFFGTVNITGVLTAQAGLANGSGQSFTLPSTTGTLALTSQLSSYLPLSGGTLTGALSGTSATFSSSVTAVGTTIKNPSVDGSTALISIKDTSDTYQIGYLNFNQNTDMMTLMNKQGYSASGISFGTNNTERVRIDVNGKVGIGTTSPSRLLHINASSDTRFLITDSAVSSTTGTYYRQFGSNSAIVNQSNGTFQLGTNDSYFLTATASGNVGIGITPQGVGSAKTLEIGSRGTIYDNNDNFAFVNNGYNDGSWRYKQTGYANSLATDGGSYTFNTAPSGSQGSAFSFTERMRITSGGELLVNTTSAGTDLTRISAPGASKNNLGLVSSDDTSGHGYIQFRNSSTTSIGSITRVGTTNAVAYNITSDYRLKEDLKSIKGLEILNKINVYDFKWKIDGSRMDGVIAHELQEILPYAVTGVKDGEQMQQVDYSKIVPVMVQAIKDLKAELDILKNK